MRDRALIKSSSGIRVAHPFVHFAKGWGIARSASALLLVIAAAATPAQSAPCGLTSIAEQSQLVYPPIARAAHVQGPVVLLATFEQDGSVSNVSIVSAPRLFDQLMGKVAATYVRSWKANAFSGPRECPIVIDFALGAESQDPKVSVVRVDAQHVKITAETAIPTTNYSIAAAK